MRATSKRLVSPHRDSTNSEDIDEPLIEGMYDDIALYIRWSKVALYVIMESTSPRATRPQAAI